MDVIKKRKKALAEAAGEGVVKAPTSSVAKGEPELLSPESIEAEYQRQKAAKKKKGWW